MAFNALGKCSFRMVKIPSRWRRSQSHDDDRSSRLSTTGFVRQYESETKCPAPIVATSGSRSMSVTFMPRRGYAFQKDVIQSSSGCVVIIISSPPGNISLASALTFVESSEATFRSTSRISKFFWVELKVDNAIGREDEGPIGFFPDIVRCAIRFRHKGAKGTVLEGEYF